MRCLLLLLLLVSPLGAWQRDWPQWRGPERDGIAHESGWRSAGQAEPLWSTRVGLGYSNVAIAAGRLVTRGYDAGAGEDITTCLDALSGEPLWEVRQAAKPLANFHGGGTLSTPTIADGRVYVVNRFGRVSCFALSDGGLHWDRNYASEFGLKVTFHGFAGSALVQGSRVTLCLGGTTMQVRARDGSLIWRNPDLGDGGYGNPVPFRFRGEACLATYPGPGLRVLRQSDGALLRSFDWRGDAGSVNSMTPLVLGERIFLSCAYNKGAALVALGDEPEGELVWSNRRFRNKVGDCVNLGELIFGFDEGMLKCIDLDGRERWRVRGLGMGSLSLSDGRLIILSSDGDLIIAEATGDEYRQLTLVPALSGGVYWTSPVLVNGLLYLRNSLGDLVCRDHRATAGSGEQGPLAAAKQGAQDQLPAPQPAELLAAHLAARGGPERLRQQAAMVLHGQIELLGEGITKSPVDVYFEAPNRYLRRVHTEFGPMDLAYDGEYGWELDPAYGNRLLEGDELQDLASNQRLHLDLEGPAAYAELGEVSSTLFEGVPCWALNARTQQGSERRLYFAKTTGLLAGHEGPTEARVEFHDWREFEGIQIPTRILTARVGTGIEENLVVEDVEWTPVPEGIFEHSPVVQRLLRSPEQVEALNADIRKAHSLRLGHYLADFAPFEGAKLQVRPEDGRLALITPRGPIFLLEPDSEQRYFADGLPHVHLRFDPPQDGHCPAIEITIGDESRRAPRVDPPR